MALNEFDIIASYFTKSNKRSDVILGVGDDCCILHPPSQKNLLITTDTLNEEIHFFKDTPPFDIGYKSLAVSLSDLAAMGGTPAWFLLSLTLSEVKEKWLEEFSAGLFSCAESFNLELVGGNMSKGPLSITTQVIGFGDEDVKLTRSGAKPEDLIYVTGCLGDPGLALAIIKKELPVDIFSSQEIEQLKTRLFRPPLRIREGQLISRIANAAIDISDGLLADLQHILDQSQVGATINLEDIPVSESLQKINTKRKLDFMLSAGDEYELCFTVPPGKVSQLERLSKEKGFHFTCIGKIDSTSGLRVRQDNKESLNIQNKGYTHF